MLLGCYLIHRTIITLRHTLYLVYLGSYLDLSLFMLHLCDLFFMFSIIFIAVNSIRPLNQTNLFLAHFLEYLLLFLDDNVDEKSE